MNQCNNRVPPKMSSVLLSKMVDQDDCSSVPSVRVDQFDREVIAFAKKNNLYKTVDYLSQSPK
jgi:hypothetical protein